MTLGRAAVVLCVALLAGCASVPAAPPGESGIAVQGTGRVRVRPDAAVLDVGVEARAPKVADATAEVNRRMRDVLARVKALGVADADIRTTAIRIEPLREPRPTDEAGARIVGYRVLNVVELRVRDVERLGPLLDGAVGAGANVVGQIQFRIADPAGAEAEARRLAMQDAAATAGQLAAAAGVRLGRLIAASEAPGFDRFAAVRPTLAVGGTPVEAGQLEVVVSVNARYAIEP
jgi:uncharacterized protein YggE